MPAGERRLAAIMFTDMVGYTSLAQKDEGLALQILSEHNQIIRPILLSCGGREVKTAGDSFLVEFSSALDAVRCAIKIQRTLRQRNEGLPLEKRIIIRIGIHVGDVVPSNGDILGDAVNVSSRIQSATEPGAIFISEQVFAQVQNKIELPFVRIRNQYLKGVDIPINVYKVLLGWEEGKQTEYVKSGKRRVAVLPFVNLSQDPNDSYFADGMTEELITVLSRVKELSVIARTSVMPYKDTSRKASEIGRELSVGTLIVGSVRKAGDTVRLAVQLVDAQSEGDIWARSYDQKLDDIFKVQSDIARRVARALKVRLVPEGARRVRGRAVRSESYILYLKGMQFRNEASEEGWRKAIEFFERAVALEPSFAEAIAAQSVCHCWLAYFAFEQPDRAYGKAKELALQAVGLSNVAEAHLSLFFVSFYHEANWKQAEAELRCALELNPSSAEAHNNYAFWLANFGRTEDAILEAEKALELDPLSEMSHVITADVYAWVRRYDRAIPRFKAALDINPNLPIAHNDLGMAYLAMGRPEEGVKELEKAKELSANSPFFRVNLAYSYAVSGKKEEARKIASELKEDYLKGHLPAYFLAVVFAGLEEREEALGWLEKAYEEHAIIFVPLLSLEPALLGLREEPRFKALLAKLGLVTQAKGLAKN